MFFDDPMLFDQAAQELLPHLAHKITITPYGGDAAPDSIAIECEDCHEPLIDFLPESSSARTARPGTREVRRPLRQRPRCLLRRRIQARQIALSNAGTPGHRQPFPNRNHLEIWRQRPGSMRAGRIDRLPRR